MQATSLPASAGTSTPYSPFAASMIATHGPLLTLAQLATLLDRREEGLRWTLNGGISNRYSDRLRAAKTRIGRRLYFKTVEIAEAIERGELEADGYRPDGRVGGEH